MNKPRILCVDDDPIMQRIYSIILANNYSFDAATTGREAVIYCQQNRYNLIVMDIRIPELDGFEAAQQIRTTTQNITTPIIGITACGWKYLLKKDQKTEFCQLIDKPVLFDELLVAIQAAIN